jgi:hypothetical protein
MTTLYGFRQRIAMAISLFMLIVSGCGSTTSPGITSFSPTGGTVGTTVTIIGTNFDTTAEVSFNGTPATVISATSTAIVVTVPPGATTGPISVMINSQGLTTTTSSNFLVLPTITSISPSSGPASTVVTITGTGFDTITANNSVSFNGTTAVVTSSTSSTIVTAVPPGATSGQITVSVNGQETISSTIFTVQ